jgi:hypothetical protein
LSLQAKKNNPRRRTPDSSKAPASPAPARTAKASHSNVGDALRSVYQHTVDEDIPPEMLDLLGKLG